MFPHKRRHNIFLIAALSTLAAGPLCSSADAAQSYPARPIRVIAPFAPGGGSDVVARLVAQHLTEAFKQQSVVENRAGAGGRVGTEVVARSPPDGYTLLLTGSGAIVYAPALYQKLPYDVQRDLAPITLVAWTAFVLLVHPTVPVRSVKELIALCKAKPGAFNYSSSGSGAPGHLSAELFQSMAKVKMTHIAYKGTGPAMLAAITGETDLSFGSIIPAVAPVQSGRLRPIAVTSVQRSSVFRDVPTLNESGLPGYETITTYGVLAPAATPQEIIATLNAALVKGLHSGDARKRLEADGSELRTSTPDEFARLIKTETEKWTRVIKQAGIKPE